MEISKITVNGTTYDIKDTSTSINGKTGAIEASDIANVLTDAGYKLTDTVFSGSYDDLTNKPNLTTKADKTSTVSNVAYDGTNKKITKTINGTTSDIVSVATLKSDMSLGSAADKNVPSSGDASSTQVVLGNDSRLTDARPASDVSSWAKASTKPSYTLDEVSDGSTRKFSDKIDKTINKTWSELKSLRDNSQLVPGQLYRITDYQCTTTQENTQSAGHQFDIIVRADSTNTLNENAYAAHHAGDTYFANSKLEAWKLLYCLDNIAWSLKPEEYITLLYGGSIRKAVYDGTEIINGTTYFRWLSNSTIGPSNKVCSISKNVGDTVYYYNNGSVGSISSIDSCVRTDATGKGTITWMKDEYNNECPYDFKNIQFKWAEGISANGIKANVFYYTFSVATGTNDATVTDHSLNDFYCYNNRIGKWITYSIQKLNFNVFMNTSTTALCYANTFGNSCYNNTFGDNCQNNTFGNNCYNNTFGNSCYNNTFGNNYISNTFENSCISNTFGNSCQNNTFGNNYISNTFENNCYNNKFGNSCYNNTFGNNCISNTFENNCYNNTFGNSCNHNTFLKDYSYYIIIENGNQYINITSTQTTSSSNKLQNITIAQGVNNTTTTKTISHDTVNDTFQTIYRPVNSVEVSI